MTIAIEAPFTFLQKPVKIVRRQAVEVTQVPLRLVPEVLNPIDGMPPLSHEGLGSALINHSLKLPPFRSL